MNGFFKASPVVVAQQWLQISGTPILGPIVVGLFQVLESSASDLGKIFIDHYALPFGLENAWQFSGRKRPG